MTRTLPKEFIEVIQSNDGLQRYLDSLLQGRSATPRSWLYEDEAPDKVLANWLNILQTLEHGSPEEQRVYQFDTSQLEKWGPQGKVAPISDLLKTIVFPTFDEHPPVRGLESGQWIRAQDKVTRRLKAAGVRSITPVAYKRVVDDMRARDTLESNSGWPDFIRRNNPEVIRAAIAAAKNGTWRDYPAIALFRNYNTKTRLVWMFPMAANVFEGSFVQPLQTAILKSGHDFVEPWRGFEGVRRYITRAYDYGCYLYASDFSATDSHFTWQATETVWEVLQPLFRNEKEAKKFRLSLHHMHNIPLVIGPDKMLVGSHGVSSGSNWTNFIETIFDEIFGYYVTYSLAQEAPYCDVSGLCGIGDDMAWISDSWHPDLPEYLEEFASRCGQHLQQEKVSAEPNAVKFLQRLFQRGYRRPDGYLRGVYSTIRALNSAIYPERFHKPQFWSSDMFCARQYMILENCVDHPLFEEFVKFVVKGQKDLIPFAHQSKADLDRIIRETKLLPGFNPTYNQEKRDTSLQKFESIRIAREL